MQNFSLKFMLDTIPAIAKYLDTTISMSLLAMIIGLVLSVIITLIRIYNIKVLKQLVAVYVSFFRGTPLLVQLFILYYGVPQVIPVFKNVNAYAAAVIGLSLNGSAYMSEILRGAILSVDKGQMEACLSVGMSHWQGMKRIVLPQAARIAIPSLGNTFIDLVKSSSLAFTLGVMEILAKAQMSASASFRFLESYLSVALIYWVMVIIFDYLQKKLEYKMNRAY